MRGVIPPLPRYVFTECCVIKQWIRLHLFLGLPFHHLPLGRYPQVCLGKRCWSIRSVRKRSWCVYCWTLLFKLRIAGSSLISALLFLSKWHFIATNHNNFIWTICIWFWSVSHCPRFTAVTLYILIWLPFLALSFDLLQIPPHT